MIEGLFWQNSKNYKARKLCALIFISILAIESIILLDPKFGSAQTSTKVNGIIFSDTTWTKANSPYVFTGPVAVNKGVTLTVEAGTIINADKYYLQVNGTLEILGTQDAPVQLNGSGQIYFNDVGTGWDEPSGTGSKIENANITVDYFSSSVSLKIINSQITTDLSIRIVDTLGRKSVFLNNNFSGKLITTNADIFDCTINQNIFSTEVTSDRYLEATDSKIAGCTVQGIAGNSLSITNCTVSNSYDSAIIVSDAGTITNCTISGGRITFDMAYRITGKTPALRAEYGSFLISGNIISGGVEISGNEKSSKNKNIEFSNNKITGGVKIYGQLAQVLNNQVVDGAIYATGKRVVIQKNTAEGIGFGGNEIVVSSNKVFKGYGIGGSTEGSAIIERNYIFNCSQGIWFIESAKITVRNNTLKNNQISIRAETSGNVEFCFNNILNYSDSIVLSTASNFEAANNYWETTDKVKIENSIHDYYDDFNLGKVNYLPILNELNSQAMPDSNNNFYSINPEATAKPIDTIPNDTINNEKSETLTWLIPFAIIIVVTASILLVIIQTRRSKSMSI